MRIYGSCKYVDRKVGKIEKNKTQNLLVVRPGSEQMSDAVHAPSEVQDHAVSDQTRHGGIVERFVPEMTRNCYGQQEGQKQFGDGKIPAEKQTNFVHLGTLVTEKWHLW